MKEFDGIESRLPVGVRLFSHGLDPETGVCKAVFEGALTPPPPKESTVDPIDDGNSGGDGDGDGDVGGHVGDGGGGENGAAALSAAEKTSLPTPPNISGEGKTDGEPPLSGDDGDGVSVEGAGVGDGHKLGTDDGAGRSLLRFGVEMDMGMKTR